MPQREARGAGIEQCRGLSGYDVPGSVGETVVDLDIALLAGRIGGVPEWVLIGGVLESVARLKLCNQGGGEPQNDAGAAGRDVLRSLGAVDVRRGRNPRSHDLADRRQGRAIRRNYVSPARPGDDGLAEDAAGLRALLRSRVGVLRLRYHPVASAEIAVQIRLQRTAGRREVERRRRRRDWFAVEFGDRRDNERRGGPALSLRRYLGAARGRQSRVERDRRHTDQVSFVGGSVFVTVRYFRR